MSKTCHHNVFVIERVYPHAPAKVFGAFSDPAAKAKWFGGPPEWEQGERSMDFRVGGQEVDEGGPKGEWSSRFDCLYQDIVADQRIVYSYRMAVNGKPISVSLAVIELRPEAGGTRLTLTEQGVYFDGLDQPKGREEGTAWLLDKLGASLDEKSPPAFVGSVGAPAS